MSLQLLNRHLLFPVGSSNAMKGRNKMVLGKASYTPYVPFYAICFNTCYYSENNILLEYTYNGLTSTLHDYYTLRSFENALGYIFTYTLFPSYTFRKGTSTYHIYMYMGTFIDDRGKILASVTIESREHLKHNTLNELAANIDYSKMQLLISTDFQEDPIYSNVFKKFKIFVEECRTAGMDIVFTKDINGKLYKHELLPLKFRNIEEKNEFLTKEIKEKINLL